MKILILGQNPSIHGRNCKSLKRLDKWLDILNLNIVSFDNIQQDYGKFYKKKVNHEYIKDICDKYDRVLALGINAGQVLADANVDHFTLPHPSFLNRKLNDPRFEFEVLARASLYLEEGI